MLLASFSDEQRHAFMRLAFNVAVSDGLLDPNEEGMLEEFRREMELPEFDELEYLELAGIEKVFADRSSRMIVLGNLCKLGYADGAFEIEEECLLNEIRKVFGVAETEFAKINDWNKRLWNLEGEWQSLLDT